MDQKEIMENFRDRDYHTLARVISLVENESEGFEKILSDLSYEKVGQVIGITGPPGAGKSTLINGLLKELSLQNKRVAVLAVDPSSPFNLGSLLGDRIRLSEHYLNPNIYIRSLASRGALGGLSEKAIEITEVLKAFGFDYIFIETVGVGQSEIEVAGLADVTVLVLVPESGDEVQFIKAGIIEVADVIAVNKSDREGADRLAKVILQNVSHRRGGSAIPEVIKTSAINFEGMNKLLEIIQRNSSGRQGDSSNERKLWLLTEKAFRLIQKKRMKGIEKEKLRELIRDQVMKKSFNLYRFVKSQCFLLILLLGFRADCKDDFKFIEMAYQKVLPGIRGAGITVNYHIKYIPGKTKQPVEMVSCWTEGKKLEIRKGRVSGDTLMAIASYRLPGERELNSGRVSVYDTTPPPVKVTGVALLLYRIGTKEKYKNISFVKKLPPLPMP